MASKIDSATVNPLLLSHIEFFFGNLAPLHIHDLIDQSSLLDPVPKLRSIGCIFEGLMMTLSRKSFGLELRIAAFTYCLTLAFGKP